MRICFKFGTTGWYFVTKGKIRLFSFGFLRSASFLFSNCTSVLRGSFEQGSRDNPFPVGVMFES